MVYTVGLGAATREQTGKITCNQVMTKLPPLGSEFVGLLAANLLRDLVFQPFFHNDLFVALTSGDFNAVSLGRRIERQFISSQLRLLAQFVATSSFCSFVLVEHILVGETQGGLSILHNDGPEGSSGSSGFSHIDRVVTAGWCDESPGRNGQQITFMMQGMTCLVLCVVLILKHIIVQRIMRWKLLRLNFVAVRALHPKERAASAEMTAAPSIDLLDRLDTSFSRSSQKHGQDEPEENDCRLATFLNNSNSTGGGKTENCPRIQRKTNLVSNPHHERRLENSETKKIDEVVEDAHLRVWSFTNPLATRNLPPDRRSMPAKLGQAQSFTNPQ